MKNDITGSASISINAQLLKVWEGLTKPELIKQYFFGTNTETDWKIGSPIKFYGEWEGRIYEDKGTILDIEPNKLIQYSYWSSISGIEDKPENYVIVTYDLFEENGMTIVTVTQENIPDEKMKEHAEQNWKKVLTGLKNILENENVVSHNYTNYTDSTN